MTLHRLHLSLTLAIALAAMFSCRQPMQSSLPTAVPQLLAREPHCSVRVLNVENASNVMEIPSEAPRWHVLAGKDCKLECVSEDGDVSRWHWVCSGSFRGAWGFDRGAAQSTADSTGIWEYLRRLLDSLPFVGRSRNSSRLEKDFTDHFATIVFSAPRPSQEERVAITVYALDQDNEIKAYGFVELAVVANLPSPPSTQTPAPTPMDTLAATPHPTASELPTSHPSPTRPNPTAELRMTSGGSFTVDCPPGSQYQSFDLKWARGLAAGQTYELWLYLKGTPAHLQNCPDHATYPVGGSLRNGYYECVVKIVNSKDRTVVAQSEPCTIDWRGCAIALKEGNYNGDKRVSSEDLAAWMGHHERYEECLKTSIAQGCYDTFRRLDLNNNRVIGTDDTDIIRSHMDKREYDCDR